MNKNYDLIVFLLSKHYPNQDFENMDDYDVYDWFWDHYGIDEDSFGDLIEDLLPLCAIAQSELTDKWYRGFGNKHLWLLKQEIK